MENEPIDRQALTLSRAIALKESGGKPDILGDNDTAAGIGQWSNQINGKATALKSGEIPANFKSYAQKYGTNPDDFSAVNQEKTLYKEVNYKKNILGWSPAQIAASHNAGDKRAADGSWQTNVGTTTLNGKDIHYDTPQYVKDVKDYYDKLSGSQTPTQGPQEGSVSGYEAPTPPTPLTVPGAGEPPREAFKADGGIIGTTQDIAHGAAKSGTGTILGAGHFGQGIQRLIGKGLDAITGGKYDFAGDAQKGVFNPDSAQGQQIREDIKPTNTAEKIGAGLETAAEFLAPVGAIGKTTGLIKGAVESGEVAPKILSKIAETIAPKQTAKDAAEALEKFGGQKAGIFTKAKINTNPGLIKDAEIVAKNVPGFKPGGSLVRNINVTKKAISTMAEDLKSRVIASGKDRIFPIKELEANLKNIKKPIELLADPVQERKFNLARQAAIRIVREKGGKVSDLLDARKEFDALVDESFPTLYDRPNAPMRTAITAIRNGITDFTVKHLPEDVNLKQSLTAQSRLIHMVENMAENAVSGSEKEVGKSMIGKTAGLIKNHPVASAFGGAALYQTAQKVPILGALLPGD